MVSLRATLKEIYVSCHLKFKFTIVTEGKPLTHSLQVQYIQQVLQARIAESPDPLKEVFSFLHFFCLSLQLEVSIQLALSFRIYNLIVILRLYRFISP